MKAKLFVCNGADCNFCWDCRTMLGNALDRPEECFHYAPHDHDVSCFTTCCGDDNIPHETKCVEFEPQTPPHAAGEGEGK